MNKEGEIRQGGPLWERGRAQGGKKKGGKDEVRKQGPAPPVLEA